MHKKLETHGNDQVADNNAVSTSLDVLREFWPRYIEIGFSSLLIGGLGLLLPLFSMLVYDKVVGNGNIETLWALSIGMLLFVLIEFVLRIVRQQTLDYLAARSDVRMERSLLGRLLDPQVTLRASVGEMLSRFKDYTLARDMLYAQYMVAMADAPFVLLFLLEASSFAFGEWQCHILKIQLWCLFFFIFCCLFRGSSIGQIALLVAS